MTPITTELQTGQPVNAGRQKPSANYTVAEFILRQLEAWGVKRIFGVIGDANLYLLDELAKQNRISYIVCRHEGAAAMMASAEAKLTGRVSVCLATSGPGIANLLNGLADAAMDQAGVLAITGQVDTSKIGTHAKQYMNQQQLIEPIVGKSELLAHPEALPELMLKSLTHSQLYGKVTHLSIPKDLYQMKVQGTVTPYQPHLHQKLLAPHSLIAETAVLIASAKKPAILLGGGAKMAMEPVRQFAEHLQAAVVTTYLGRPLFPNDHELYAGGLGQGGSEASSLLLAESDLILVLGAAWWPEEYTPTTAKIVQIDKSPASIGIGHPLDKGIVGDLQDILPGLLSETKPTDRSAWKQRVSEVTKQWKTKIEQEANQPQTPLAPQRVIKAIADFAAADAIIAVDTGDHTLWFNRIFQAKQQEILLSGRWRTLGFGLPAAIAAKLEYPHRQVIALVGDGGSMQTLLEFQTAVQYELPIVMIVMNNSSYAMEKNRMIVSGLQTLGSGLASPDFSLIAQACGGTGIKAAAPSELENSLKQALEQQSPTLIDVKVEPTVVPHTKI